MSIREKHTAYPRTSRPAAAELPGSREKGVRFGKAETATSETMDEYGCVLAGHDRWRVVRCRDDVQDIVQKRTGGGKWPWRATAYVLCRKRLSDVRQRQSLGTPQATVACLLDQMRMAAR